MTNDRPLGTARAGRSRTRIAIFAGVVLPLWSLAHATVTVPTLVLLAVVAWALAATVVAGVALYRVRRGGAR